jgi:predicted nucleic acid-binding protein
MTPRIFIDSSVLFSAAYSAKGYSRDLILMRLSGQIRIVLSNYVLEETRRNLAQLKRPPMDEFEDFLVNAGLEIIEINRRAVLDAGKLIILKDAPIIAAAKIAKVDMLVSLDKRHILDHPELETYIQAFIMTPAQAFQKLKVIK